MTGHLGYKLQGRIQRITGLDPAGMSKHGIYRSIVGSVVECSPATRAARVRFPDDAILFSDIADLFSYIMVIGFF